MIAQMFWCKAGYWTRYWNFLVIVGQIYGKSNWKMEWRSPAIMHNSSPFVFKLFDASRVHAFCCVSEERIVLIYLLHWCFASA